MGRKKKQVTLIDLECYTFCYELIYSDKDTRDCFFDYLITTHNEEAIYFIQKVQQFKKKDLTNNKKAKLAIEIFNCYLKDGGKYELNLSSKDRQHIKEEYEKVGQLDNCETCLLSDNIFTALEQQIHLSLKEANFPHFIKSPKFRELAMKQTTDFLDKIGFRMNAKKIDIIQRLLGSSSSIIASPSTQSLASLDGSMDSFRLSESLTGPIIDPNAFLRGESSNGWKLLDKHSHITVEDFRFMACKVFEKDSKAQDMSKFFQNLVGDPSADSTSRRQSAPNLASKSASYSERSMSLSVNNSPSLQRYNSENNNVRKISIDSSSNVTEYFEDMWTKSEKKTSNYTLYSYDLKTSMFDEADTDVMESLKNIHIFKTEVEYPYNVDFVVETFARSQYRIDFDNMLKESFSLDFMHVHQPPSEGEVRREEVSSSMLQEVWRFSYSLLNLKDRSFIVESSLMYDEQNRAYLLLKKSVDNVIIDDSDCVRGRLLQLMVFERKEKEKTIMTDFVVLDMKDSVNNIIFENCVAKRAKEFYDKGMSALKANMELIKHNFPTPSDSDRILETLVNNNKCGYCKLGFKLRTNNNSDLDDLDDL
ncbi:predicted protein [Naegleria gruberi]|uniref:Predicted protein n=1 Tax=Naegleria gruberi TaxID=5762 RepID=D2V557_NAEGR|nr:uncharacterized protein NAEGRDRAFT_46791 [Naegleria gruberi]EFC48052.1 predicted protein [Naegleria gruberi]|eukprot:XP_002680796.1 predicted protein [Naegleria gruberi strain NEG-M]